ncbi:MAG: hypothetical protein KGZ57_04640 [Dethiobacter sp.]|nr:hypothetical protein [Dethiobacter sp.]MCL5982133.1 hypothetical protein [Bacillota bacterium]
MGLGLGIITIFASLSSYIAGELSDTHGRKPYLVASVVISPVIFISYPLLPLLEQVSRELMLTVLVVLLVTDGIADGVWDTVEAIYLAGVERPRKFKATTNSNFDDRLRLANR